MSEQGGLLRMEQQLVPIQVVQELQEASFGMVMFSSRAVLENIRQSPQREAFNRFARNILSEITCPRPDNPAPRFVLVQADGLSVSAKTLGIMAVIQEILDLPEFKEYVALDNPPILASYRHIFEDMDLGFGELAEKLGIRDPKPGFATDDDYRSIARNITTPIRDGVIEFLPRPRIHFEDYIGITALPPLDCEVEDPTHLSDCDVVGAERGALLDLYQKQRQGFSIFSYASDLSEDVREEQLRVREDVVSLPADKILEYLESKKKSDTRRNPKDIQRSAKRSGTRELLEQQRESIYPHIYTLMNTGELNLRIPSEYGGDDVTIDDFIAAKMSEREFIDHLRSNRGHREHFTRSYIRAWQKRLLGEKYVTNAILITQDEITDGIGEDRGWFDTHEAMYWLQDSYKQTKDAELRRTLVSLGGF